MKRYLVVSVLAIGLALLLAPQHVHATKFGFYNITNNDPTAIDVAGQLFVDVIDPGPGQILFWFTNVGPTTSFIDEVYFDDGTLLELAGLIDVDDTALSSPPAPDDGHDWVDFTQYSVDPVKPPDLPGGESMNPEFDVTGMFSADTDDPGTDKYGVDVNEWLGIVFNLQSGKAYEDVIAALNSGELRIGLHVQGIDAPDVGKSDSFVNNPTSIPDPLAVFLLGSACLIGFAEFRRKAKK